MLGPAASASGHIRLRVEGWCGVAAGIVAALGVITLALFYALQAPHIHASHRWGTDPGASLGYANDVSGIVWALLLIPVAWAMRRELPPARANAATFWLGLMAMVTSAVAGIGMVLGVLSAVVEGVIAGGGSVLIVVWIGLVSRQAGRHGVLTDQLSGIGQVAAVTLVVSLVLVGGSFALPRSPVSIALSVIFGLPGLAAYLAVPFWCAATGASLANRGDHARTRS